MAKEKQPASTLFDAMNRCHETGEHKTVIGVTAMATTYYRIWATGVVARATTKHAQEKLRRKAREHPYMLTAISPKRAKQLIAEGHEYWKVKDLL